MIYITPLSWLPFYTNNYARLCELMGLPFSFTVVAFFTALAFNRMIYHTNSNTVHALSRQN